MTAVHTSSKNLLYQAQWVFLIVSIIPLAILTFVCMKYVFPLLETERQSTLATSVYVTIGLTVLLSVLGYILSRRNTVSTIGTIEGANQRLASLLASANRLSHMTMMDKTFEEATRSAVSILGADAVLGYMLLDDKLICQHVEGVTLAKPEKLSYPIGVGLVGEAVRIRQLLRVPDAGGDSRFVDNLSPLTGLRSGPVMAYPMLYQDRLVGAIEIVRSAGGRPFTEEDRQMLEILGQQATSTMINAEFHEAQQNYFAHMMELLRLSLENDIVWENHLHNVARLSNLISRRLRLDEETRKEIHFAAMLHDIGFLKMRQVVGQTQLEGFLDRVKDHPVLGAQLIQPIKVWKNIAPLIHHHHEMCDGSGYPNGLKKEEIPLGARIVCVAEAFETMTNPASYARTKTRQEALAELETEAGTKYDERVVRAFLEALEEEE